MRAAVLRHGAMVVLDDVADPVPGPGQVLVELKACGICGSDLHFASHGSEMVELIGEMRGTPYLGGGGVDVSRDVFMGHEFSAEVLAPGPGTEAPPAGTLVTSVPVMVTAAGVSDLAYSNELPAGYGERMLLAAPLVQVVPNGLDARRAALTEPMAVGEHAVGRSAIVPGEGAIVLGCGPIGVAVVAALVRRGIEPIVAADYSALRRSLAEAMGAHEVVDPAEGDVFEVWAAHGGLRTLVVFEAVGVPGMIDAALRAVPARSRIVVVGVCMGADRITPFWGIAKELSVQFAFAYDVAEFAGTLRAIAEGQVDVSPMITGEVGLDAIADAFSELAHPDRHCKILVTP